MAGGGALGHSTMGRRGAGSSFHLTLGMFMHHSTSLMLAHGQADAKIEIYEIFVKEESEHVDSKL